ncbi:MAG: hypothetical protein FWD36_00785 [Treponema sp.]|nr:hypothetical protein [Treponema sp.]
MNRRLYLSLCIVIVVGIQPVFAQNQVAINEEMVTTIDLGFASDNEFSQALGSATDVEIEMVTGRGEPLPEEETVPEGSALSIEPNADTEPVDAEPVLAELADAEPADAEPADAELADAEPTDAQPAVIEPVLAEEAIDAQPVAEETMETELADLLLADSEAAIAEEQEIPQNIQNNEYFLESQRLAKLAQEAYDYGDYDASANFAHEAIRYALLSDEYVAQQTGTATPSGTVIRDDGTLPLPATYTVRTWNAHRDCLWNIAGYPWVYGNPRQWRVLYNANRSKLPDPNNPNLIEPGTVLDIPSIKDEVRQGSWDTNKTYPSLN